jgi:signal recognition particle GTPase
MFESLTKRLQWVFQNLGRRGKLRPVDIYPALQGIRVAILESDGYYQVVKGLLEIVSLDARDEWFFDPRRSLGPSALEDH